ncbi:MAG: NUDIX hydrolase [Candidatus Saccharimonadales bacterium]
MNVVYVDKDDRVIGSGSITDALNKGIRVRISRVFLENKSSELLIQKRSATHLSLPGKWDQTAAGHVDAGEDYEKAAYRELKEEMGIDGVTLVRVKSYYSEESDETQLKKRFNTLFAGDYDGPVNIDHHEVSAFRWVTIEELDQEMTNHPSIFTEGAINAFREYIKYKASLSLVNQLTREG